MSRPAGAYAEALHTGELRLGPAGVIALPHLIDSFDYIGLDHQLRRTDRAEQVEPALLAECLYRLIDFGTRRPFIVAANGVATNDEETHDEYVRGAIAHLRSTIQDGAKIAGYFHHSGIDGYEWHDGFTLPRGLIDRDRRIKSAGEFLQQTFASAFVKESSDGSADE